jgi:hypothetical protein
MASIIYRAPFHCKSKRYLALRLLRGPAAIMDGLVETATLGVCGSSFRLQVAHWENDTFFDNLVKKHRPS